MAAREFRSNYIPFWRATQLGPFGQVSWPIRFGSPQGSQVAPIANLASENAFLEGIAIKNKYVSGDRSSLYRAVLAKMRERFPQWPKDSRLATMCEIRKFKRSPRAGRL
jgi:hypothetical protein